MKTTISYVLLGLGLVSASAFAGHMNEAMPTASGVNLIAPHQDGYWTFGAQANYFQPNNDFNYAYGSFSTTTSGTPTINDIQSRTFAVDSDNDWGWGVDVTYHFPGEGRDVTLAFTQLNTSDSNSVEVGDGEFATINPMLSGRSSGKNLFGLETAFGSAEGEVDTNYDAVDLTFGQLISVGRRVDLHPFAGLRYAYIDYKATGEYSNFSIIDPTVDSELVGEQTLKSNFQGVGPRLGSDAMVNLGRGFSLKGTLGVSLLAGSIDAEDGAMLATLKTSSRGSSVEIVSETIVDHDIDTSTRVVPEADAKLAAMYHTEFSQGYGVGFEVGYQVTNYFNAIVNNTVDDTVSTSTQYTDFFMQGPYARIQLDVA